MQTLITQVNRSQTKDANIYGIKLFRCKTTLYSFQTQVVHFLFIGNRTFSELTFLFFYVNSDNLAEGKNKVRVCASQTSQSSPGEAQGCNGTQVGSPVFSSAEPSHRDPALGHTTYPYLLSYFRAVSPVLLGDGEGRGFSGHPVPEEEGLSVDSWL